mmetsp:Transcript_109727/g.211070  ORF Transcript_109727/g.211070 Transcript_109727/m.211070 type:complete len:243 (+) Transcript_109727:2047-2775(+)
MRNPRASSCHRLLLLPEGRNRSFQTAVTSCLYQRIASFRSKSLPDRLSRVHCLCSGLGKETASHGLQGWRRREVLAIIPSKWEHCLLRLLNRVHGRFLSLCLSLQGFPCTHPQIVNFHGGQVCRALASVQDFAVPALCWRRFLRNLLHWLCRHLLGQLCNRRRCFLRSFPTKLLTHFCRLLVNVGPRVTWAVFDQLLQQALDPLEKVVLVEVGASIDRHLMPPRWRFMAGPYECGVNATKLT